MSFSNPISMIIIDDSNNDVTLIRRSLRSYSQEITYTRVDTEDALSRALGVREWDIALCDYAMPGLTLDTVLSLLKARSPDLPIVMVTGTVGEEAVADVMRQGVADVVLKDRLVPRLAPIVAREIGKGRQRRAAAAQTNLIASVLGIFSEVADWRKAMELSLARVGETFGATFAAMFELKFEGGVLQPIAEWADGGTARLLATMLNTNPPKAVNSLLGQAVLNKQAYAARFADLPDLANYPFCHAAAGFGMVSIIVQPMPVGKQIFGVSLIFPVEHEDLGAIQIQLDAISDALRPLLFRKISDNERTLLLKALNATQGGVIITEAAPPGLKIVYVNRATCEMTGYDQHALLGNTPRIFQGADTDPAALVKLHQGLAANEAVSVELLNYRQDGTEFWVALDIVPIYDRGRVTHFIAIQTDVTRRRAEEQERAKDAEELVRMNENLVQMAELLTARTTELVDAARLARMGTWSLIFAPRSTTWSPETYAILGQDPAQFVVTPGNILNCVHPDDKALFSAGYKRLGRTRNTHEMEYRIVRPDGETRVLRELARPKLDATGDMVGIVGVVQDITEHKTAEKALLHAERLKTIGQITGGIAHDFNNLLTVVGLNLESALDAEDLPEAIRDALEPALHAAHRGGELTAQMLSYAGRQSLKPRVIGLAALIHTLRSLLLRALGKRNHLTIAMPGDDVRLEIDPSQFENALMNLVINARDAMIEEGTVHISFTPVQVTAPLATLPDEVPPGDYIRVRVADTGGGIAPSILPRIFEPFFTTKAAGTGTGLGLGMVYGFVHQSRGRMTISSALGAGTTVDLYLPPAEPAKAAEPASIGRQSFRVQNRSVLLVEDGDVLRQTLHHMFVELGFETLSVATAAEAMAALDLHRSFDLLFIDITLPGGMSGVKLASEVEALRPGIVIVLTSGHPHQIDPSLNAKWTLLPKPLVKSAITALLEKLWP